MDVDGFQRVGHRIFGHFRTVVLKTADTTIHAGINPFQNDFCYIDVNCLTS